MGDFVFRPSAADSGEDVGVLMGYVRDADHSELAILDAETLETMASVRLPRRVPSGFHGNWVPTATQRFDLPRDIRW
ncbi:carotenoid oxygenase family protein [Nocardia vinacea]|uniref:carotenoid oxygenase family protein n=1 Tax=Nocardia vinacea TaxID=96468 RepID=UPI003AF24C46